jgi:SAM-dependent methyltransferase
MRRLVGTDDPAEFDNPSGDLIWPFLGEELYRSVFDFGCGCGRLARRLQQQRVRPERYLGVDVHRGMVAWCQENLSAVDPNFVFARHDTELIGFNPGPHKPHVKAFDAPDAFATLAIGCSVFTHLVEDQVEFYLREIARVLRPGGAFIGTWFTFDKRQFPMMQTFQNALYINLADPSNAVARRFRAARRVAAAVAACEC